MQLSILENGRTTFRDECSLSFLQEVERDIHDLILNVAPGSRAIVYLVQGNVAHVVAARNRSA